MWSYSVHAFTKCLAETKYDRITDGPGESSIAPHFQSVEIIFFNEANRHFLLLTVHQYLPRYLENYLTYFKIFNLSFLDTLSELFW